MSSTGKLQPLLTVQSRRVDQAMEALRACNELLRTKTLDRDTAYARWMDADAALSREQRSQVTSIAGKLRQSMAAFGLVIASDRCEWLRARAAELWTRLDSAEAELRQALLAATDAQHFYRQVLAKHDALSSIAEQWQRERVKAGWRAEEHLADDLLAHNHIAPGDA